MKCPYRKIVYHQVSSTDSLDREEFAECYGEECPFYALDFEKKEFCLKADRGDK